MEWMLDYILALYGDALPDEQDCPQWKRLYMETDFDSESAQEFYSEWVAANWGR